MHIRTEKNKPFNIRDLFLGTCLATGLIAAPAAAKDIEEIGTDLGGGVDTGTVAGGTVNVSGGPHVTGIGVSTGLGDDDVENTGDIDVDVLADEVVIFSGLNPSQDGADVVATGIGFYADNGDDILLNTGEINVQTSGIGVVTNLGLSLLGFFNVNAPSTVEAFGYGIDGGEGGDVVENQGSIFVNTVSGLSMIGQAPSSYEQNAVVSITADATTIGMRGALTGDPVLNGGVMILGANALANSSTLDAEIVNGVVVDSSTNANAIIIGIEGSENDDLLTNSGTIGGISSASAFRGSFAVSLSDGGIADNSINATAHNTGLFGGWNEDTLDNSGTIFAGSVAMVESDSMEFNLIDVSGGTFNLAPEAISIGMDGGNHDDVLNNSGLIQSSATANSISNSVNLSLVDATIIGGRISAGFDAGDDEDGELPIQAQAIGMAGGDGEDQLTNFASGAIELTGNADADSVAISVAAIGVPDAAFQAIFEGESLASLDTFASSQVVGMDGGLDADELWNFGDITGGTLSMAQQVGVAVSVPVGFLPNELGYLPGFTLGGAGAGAWSNVIGMAGGDGEDMLFNSGLIDLTSTADALAVGVSVELPDLGSASDGFAVDLSLTLADVVTEADAFATGMAGGDDNDVLLNAAGGEVTVAAYADAASTGVGVTAAVEQEGVISEGVAVRASTDAEADATAIDGGDGDDEIYNDGIADALADATATTVGVTVALEGIAGGGAAGISVVDGSANATATAQSITGGDGADLLINNGALGADAIAEGSATGVSVALTGAQMGGFAGAGTLSNTSATATADASGVDWSSSDKNAENFGSIETNATATAHGDSISVAVSGTMAGFTIDASLADSNTIANATASAFNAPDGDHAISNFETLSAVSTATADSVSVGVELGVVIEGGLAAGVSLTRAVTDATATSTGIISDVGVDDILNLGTINSEAFADASSTSVAIGVNGTMAGVALNAAAADASSTATATATGISTGAFDDTAVTIDSLTALADADAHSDSVAVELGVAVSGGVAAGGALTRGNITAAANAIGVSTGDGADELGAAGEVDVTAISMADADAVSVAMEGTAAGLAGGASLVEATTTANADASALNAGAGDDMVENASELTALSMAEASSTSVGVQIGAAGAGVTGGLSLANVSTDANALTGAIEGGLGADSILNTTEIDADADAQAFGASVSVSLNGVLTGASVSAALTDATVDANAYATGIAGDDAARPEEDGDEEEAIEVAETGAENADTIVNTGLVTVDSYANSSGSAVSVAAPVAFVPLGFALATAENTATGYAYGIDGGYGDDIIFNMGDLIVTSDVDVSGASVSAAATFLALGGFDGTANSSAFGMTGGFGDDFLFNNATIDSNAFADASGVTVGLNLIGGAVGDLGTIADANAFGMFGDAGADMLINEFEVFSTADAQAASTSVNIAVTGFTVADVSTKAFADSTGIGGGAGDDTIYNTSLVDAGALAETPSVSVSVTGVGANFNDATTRSEATAHGLSGDGGADAIVNENTVLSTATANTTGVGVTVGLLSGGTADISTVADSEAIGVTGGDDGDALVNLGTIVSTATSTSSSAGVNVSIAGASFADADAESISNAVGMSGDAGDDEILNDGSIVSTSTAVNAAGAVTIAVGGFSDGDISTFATANASGIDGGDGDDLIGHTGSIVTTTTASVNAQAVSVGLVGAGITDVRLTASTNALGIDAGAGDDQVVTDVGSTIDVNASISGGANNTTVQLVGASSNNNVFGFAPSATGFAGGAGNDFFALYGTADIDATSTFSLNNTAVTLVGAALDDSAIASNPVATGLTGDAGDDVIYIADLLDARSVNTVSLGGYTFNLAGYAGSKPSIGGTAKAIGVDAGADDDTLLVDGRINANASSTNTLSGTQTSIVGANQTNAQAGAFSTSTGVLGGSGEDVLLANGIIDVDASATTHLSATNFNAIGATSADGVIGASATGVGMSGGDDNDVVGNNGDLYVDTTAALTTSGSVKVGVGAASSGSTTTSVASSTGLRGDDGDDVLFNTGFIRSRATATGTISRTGYAFIGGANTSATATTTALAFGIGGGDGADDIENTGDIEVRATSSTDGSSNTTATIGGAKASSTVSASARAVGMDGGAGDDFIKNFGNITVVASASPDSTNSATASGLFTDGVTNSRTSTSTRVIGIDGGADENEIWNTGDLTVETTGLARTESRSNGVTLGGIDIDAIATAISSNNGQNARGVSAGDEATTLYNNGTIDVAIRGAGYAYANANGGSIADGDGTATATVGVSDAYAYGFVAGNGGNMLVNTGDIIVLSRPTGNADALSDADGIISTTQPDSRSIASVALNRARAYGVWFGDGDDVIVNEGSIDVTSAPQANRAETDASFGGDVLGIDSFATSTANANDALAYGIRAGDGENVILNTGSIIARSQPRAVAHADARGVGFDGDAEARATANAEDAHAYGIETGNDDDLIWNEGSIEAISNPSVSATAVAVGGRACIIDIGDVEVCQNGEVVEDPDTSVSGRRAVGVATNDGADVLVNAGSITASIGSGIGNGEAILLGGGDDLLALLDGSSVLGSIRLGSGNDTLLLSGVPTTNSAPNGDSGTDTVLFEGAGSFSSGLTSFEIARKTGAGTFSVPFLPTMSTLDVQGGVLQSLIAYNFGASSAYDTFVDGNGDHGRLASAGLVSLNGDINVSANVSLFADGQTFDVVTGALVINAFDTENLPAPTALLSFDLVQTASAVQIVADAASFAIVASPGDAEFAAQLDSAALVAGGALEGYLAQLQFLPEGADFESEIAQLNPTRFDEYAQDAASTVEQFEDGARQRLSMLRQLDTEALGAGGFVQGVKTLSFDQTSQQLIGDGVGYGSWRAEFNSGGSAFGDRRSTVSGFDYLTPSGNVIGASLGVTHEYALSPSLTGLDSTIENFMLSFYGSHRISETQYLDAIVSYGRQDYASTAPGYIQHGPSLFQSEHSGHNMSASVETGRSYSFAGGRSEIFSGLRYASLAEGRFDALVPGNIGFDVDRSDTHGLEGEIGVRAGWLMDTPLGAFAPRMSLSWNRRLGLSGDNIVATFADAPGFEFNLTSQLRNASELRVGAGFDLWKTDKFSISSRFETDLLDPDGSLNSLVDLKVHW